MVDPKIQKPHAIFVAYPLQGHLIPAVHLAIKLASRGFIITFINTESVHRCITTGKNGSDGGLTDDIFSELKDSGLDIRYTTVSDGLPIEFDRSLNHDQFMASLVYVFSAHVEEAVKRIVTTEAKAPVSCLIADTFFVWPGNLAKKYELLFVSFWTEPALVFSLYYHVHLLRQNSHFDSIKRRKDSINYIPGVETLDPKDLTSYLQSSDTSTICHQLIFKAFNDSKTADFVLCNTVQELEPETISALQSEKPFFAIGPLFPSGFTKSTVATSLWSESDCIQWLNTKPHGSVLYVSFGSYAHLTKTELLEIAYGLSLSNVNFVWVLRPDIVSSTDVDPLPKGFREENYDRGMIVSWCCQVQVLAHPAIAGFLTHCGWNSILESIWFGVPLLCFPLLTDQFTNRKLVVDDWKIGMNLCDRKPINRVEVSEKIKQMVSGNNYPMDKFREVMNEQKKTMRFALSEDGSSEKNVDIFIKDLKVIIQKKNESSIAEK